MTPTCRGDDLAVYCFHTGTPSFMWTLGSPKFLVPGMVPKYYYHILGTI